MCGIAGIFKIKGNIAAIDHSNMKNALDRQAYRGPDSKGIWEGSQVVLGHNRLSIIDLSTAANQPYVREDLGLRIAFNGEIYNYKVLKSDLENKGYQFYTSSDTEVILVAYHFFGTDLMKHLVGMFAFIIYDDHKNEAFIAKDRYGEKPLFFVQNEGGFFMASELGSLRELYKGPLTINQNAVVDLMENMYINLHHTIYNEVEVFQPGTSLLLNKNGAEWHKYYTFPTEAPIQLPFSELKKQVKEKLYQIVQNELQADVPVATFLSSGVDSSLITAISKDLKSDIVAITMSNKDLLSDESVAAAEFAKKLGIEHEIVGINPDSLQVLVDLMRNMQPLADASLIPSYLVTKQARQFATVMLSGDGGDEVFGSYQRPTKFGEVGTQTKPFGKTVTRMLMDAKKGPLRKFGEKYMNDRNRMRLGGWAGYYEIHNLNYGLGYEIFNNYQSINYVGTRFKELENRYSSNPEKVSFGVDIETRLPADFLYKLDSSAMLNSMEVRAPFLDHTLVDYMLSIDTRSMLPNGIDKELTRSLLEDFTKEEYNKSKKGFSFPYSDFLAKNWGDQLRSFLQEGKSSQYFNFNIPGILKILGQHQKSPNQRSARLLFSILVLEIWLRVFHLETELEIIDYKTLVKSVK